MTVVAFGTSAPEFLVSLQAAIKGNPEISIGNVIGSNIANIGLILGVTALIYPLVVARNSIRIDWPVMMGATLAFLFAASDGRITRLEGWIGFAFLVVFTAYQIYNSRKQHVPEEEQEEKPAPIGLAIVYIVGSAVGLAYGADFLIQGASNIAKSMGVSERIIGVTIVAFGTSLPELAASVSAAFKKQTDIAIGNIIGSNIFNILCVICLTSVVKPIPVAWNAFSYDFIWMAVFAFILILLVLPIRTALSKSYDTVGSKMAILFEKGKLGRIGGALLVVMYIYYIYTLFG